MRIGPRKSARDSCCRLVTDQRLRSAVDQQTAAIQGNFPRGIAKPALRALLAAGYHQFEQLAGVSAAELLKLHGMGPKALAKLRAGLKAQGLDFRRE